MKDRCAHLRRKARFIVELQYPTVPQFLDCRGRIIGNMHPQILPKFKDWDAAADSVLFTDDRRLPTAELLVGSKRISIILEDPDSLQVFLDLADKALTLAHKELGAWLPEISRIGMRLISVAQSPSDTYEGTLEVIKSRFHQIPTTLPLNIRDTQAIIVHDYGRLAIGPTKSGDTWLKAVFKKPDARMPAAGVALDIDSYGRNIAVRSVADIKAAVSSVANMTLALEEDVLNALTPANVQA